MHRNMFHKSHPYTLQSHVQNTLVVSAFLFRGEVWTLPQLIPYVYTSVIFLQAFGFVTPMDMRPRRTPFRNFLGCLPPKTETTLDFVFYPPAARPRAQGPARAGPGPKQYVCTYTLDMYMYIYIYIYVDSYTQQTFCTFFSNMSSDPKYMPKYTQIGFEQIHFQTSTSFGEIFKYAYEHIPCLNSIHTVV